MTNAFLEEWLFAPVVTAVRWGLEEVARNARERQRRNIVHPMMVSLAMSRLRFLVGMVDFRQEKAWKWITSCGELHRRSSNVARHIRKMSPERLMRQVVEREQ